jgi:RNA polymerase sigma-70 factor, ECF subfamily
VVNTRLGDEDGSLLERVQRGDDQALALLYDRYSSLVYSIALRVLRDPALAEQILSDIFLEVWRSPKRFMQITGSLSPSTAIEQSRCETRCPFRVTPAWDQPRI